jgi:transketolase
MCYVRTARPEVACIYDANTHFEVGGAHMLADGDDVILVSNGYMLTVCRALLPELEKQGIRAGLLDAYSFPIRSQMLRDLAADRGRVLVTAEDNYVGGLAGAVAELAAAQGGARVVGVTARRVPKSGKTAEDCFAYAGCARADILAAVRSALGR